MFALMRFAARDDVEKAIMKWGRFRLALNPGVADLVIVLRQGSGKIVQPTIGGLPTNDRPGVVQPTDGGIRLSYIERRRCILEGILGENAKLGCLVGQSAELFCQLIYRLDHHVLSLRFPLLSHHASIC